MQSQCYSSWWPTDNSIHPSPRFSPTSTPPPRHDWNTDSGSWNRNHKLMFVTCGNSTCRYIIKLVFTPKMFLRIFSRHCKHYDRCVSSVWMANGRPSRLSPAHTRGMLYTCKFGASLSNYWFSFLYLSICTRMGTSIKYNELLYPLFEFSRGRGSFCCLYRQKI